MGGEGNFTGVCICVWFGLFNNPNKNEDTNHHYHRKHTMLLKFCSTPLLILFIQTGTRIVPRTVRHLEVVARQFTYSFTYLLTGLLTYFTLND